MKKTVSLLLAAVMLLGVTGAMAIPGQPSIGSHQSLGDQGGVRSAVIDAANWHGIVIDRPTMDAMGLKFSAKGRFTDNLTEWSGFQFRLGEDSDKGRASDVDGRIRNYSEVVISLMQAYVVAKVAAIYGPAWNSVDGGGPAAIDIIGIIKKVYPTFLEHGTWIAPGKTFTRADVLAEIAAQVVLEDYNGLSSILARL